MPILAAVASGKAAFCEKPMAETLEEAGSGIAVAKAVSRPPQVGLNAA